MNASNNFYAKWYIILSSNKQREVLKTSIKIIHVQEMSLKRQFNKVYILGPSVKKNINS